MTQEALKLALEALKKCHYYMIDAGLPNQSLLNEAFTAYKALEALKEHSMQEVQRLGQEIEQEHVAYLCEPDENGLYGLPLTEKTCTKCFPVYRHPQRTWVGLTDDDWDDIFGAAMTIGEAIKTTEAKLKEKNNAA